MSRCWYVLDNPKMLDDLASYEFLQDFCTYFGIVCLRTSLVSIDRRLKAIVLNEYI